MHTHTHTYIYIYIYVIFIYVQVCIHTHTCFMTTNYPSRLSHRVKMDGSDDLLFRVSRGGYRRYNPTSEPQPTYPTQESKLSVSSQSMSTASADTREILTLRVRLRQHVESHYKMGEEFRMSELKRVFQEQNPDNSPNAIHGHTCFMTTNLPSRLSHRLKTDG